MPTFPVSTSYINGSVYQASDVNAYGTAINALYNGTGFNLLTAKGDLITGTATAGTGIKTAVGADNTILYASTAASGGVAWGTITTAMIGALQVTGAKIANDTITATQVAADVYVRYSTSFTATSANIYMSTASPTGGSAGDIWFKF
jgi:hypothetical protein